MRWPRLRPVGSFVDSASWPHPVAATCLSLAAASMRALLPSGNAPTTLVRRRISRISRSRGLLVRRHRQCSAGMLPFVTLAIEIGALYGVIRTLQWGSVDFENRCLKWGKDKTASGTGRVIPLLRLLEGKPQP